MPPSCLVILRLTPRTFRGCRSINGGLSATLPGGRLWRLHAFSAAAALAALTPKTAHAAPCAPYPEAMAWNPARLTVVPAARRAGAVPAAACAAESQSWNIPNQGGSGTGRYGQSAFGCGLCQGACWFVLSSDMTNPAAKGDLVGIVGLEECAEHDIEPDFACVRVQSAKNTA